METSLEVFTAYDLWIVTHSVGVVKDGGYKNVQQFGYEVSYPHKPRVTVIEILPKTQFIRRIGAQVAIEADLQLNGRASMPDAVEEFLEHVENLSLGADVKMSAKANLVGRLSFSLMTPRIQAIGIGDSSSEWLFEKEDAPLLGDQLMVQILLTPKRLKQLTCEARLYATIGTFDFLPTRLVGEWVPLQIPLV